MPKKKTNDLDGLNFEVGTDLGSGLDGLDLGGTLDSTDFASPKAKSPLKGVKYSGSLEADAPKEISALLSAFKAKAKEEQKRFVAATDSEFWFAVCFQTREQKETFLKLMEWAKHGDKYLDGGKLAKQMGLELPPADVRYQGEKVDRKIANLKSI